MSASSVRRPSSNTIECLSNEASGVLMTTCQLPSSAITVDRRSPHEAATVRRLPGLSLQPHSLTSLDCSNTAPSLNI